jgi:predicted DNA-binding protein with PD1-like motif
MKYKRINQFAGMSRFVVVFDIGDSILDELQRLCEREAIFAAAISAIGGFQRVTVAWYDLEDKRYEPIEIDEQVEVVSFLGNVTAYENKPKIHVHCAVGRRDGSMAGGHLLGAIVRPTLELLIQELPMRLQRTDRPDIGIPLIEI